METSLNFSKICRTCLNQRNNMKPLYDGNNFFIVFTLILIKYFLNFFLGSFLDKMLLSVGGIEVRMKIHSDKNII